MTTNSVTKLYVPGGIPDEQAIQDHLDTQNNNGYSLVAIENMGGWYRFFWEKVV